MTDREILHSQLGNGRFVRVPLPLPKELHPSQLILLAFLVDRDMYKERMAREVDFKDYDGMFKLTGDTMFKLTGLPPVRQSQALHRLAELGYIEIHKRGLPPERYIRINDERTRCLLVPGE